MPTTKASPPRSGHRADDRIRTTSRRTDPDGPVPQGMNLAVIRGVLARDPDHRVLGSGVEVLSLDVTVRAPDSASESVPVVWHNPAVAAARLQAGDDIVVVGRVRRRFFRVAGVTSSRTEVHADKVLGAGSVARIRTLLAPRLDELDV